MSETRNHKTYNTELKEFARQNRKQMTPPEKKLWHKILKVGDLAEYKFLRQKPLGNYIADYYCSELKLVIELDGMSHNEKLEYDARRTADLERLGLRVVRYLNTDVIKNAEGVYEHLLMIIKEIKAQSENISLISEKV